MTTAQAVTLVPPTPHDLRDQLTQMVINDLLGPAGGAEEELDKDERIRERYLVGLLAPQNVPVEADAQDQLATTEPDDAEVGATDADAPAHDTLFPSAMGLSAMLDLDTLAIVIDSAWGRYLRVPSEQQVNRDETPALVWKRQPMIGQPLPITVQDGSFGPLAPCPDPDDGQLEVVIEGRLRKTPHGWLLTVFLVNRQAEPAMNKDLAWLFQPWLQVHAPDHRPLFVQRRFGTVDLSKLDPITRTETEALAMLYRHHHEFAVGHGVAVHVTQAEPGAARAIAVETTFTPMAEVAQQTPPTVDDPGFENLAGLTLDMQELANLAKPDLIATLRVMADAYQTWIQREVTRSHHPAEGLADHQNAATAAITACQRAHDRIQAGIALIDQNPQAEAAFRFANRAMALQRVHAILAQEVRKKVREPGLDVTGVDIPDNRRWRLFQLAFILLNLPSVTDLHHPDRSHATEAIADLLWFATGGGKTEAYLGLTAYVLALRRLQGAIEGRRGDHGVAVLMRYTLRLLTVQQFQRAAALLCACEVIRRQDPATWGEPPFRLGLWVGKKNTPNTLQQAAEVLEQAQGNHYAAATARIGTPHQITGCPWCGEAIGLAHLKVYTAPSDIGRAVTYCGDALGLCPFSEAQAPKEGLPIMVVDEDIYHRPPALLIATVDKFAQMPWKGEVQMLFGQVNGECPRHGFLSPDIADTGQHPARGGLPRTTRQPHGPLRPPDLIIQDELHLISGPLGSMVGLYESAVDALCSWTVDKQTVRPKVIASTATIRRAEDQVKKLFVRKLEVFPPQGTTLHNNFFALHRPPGPEYPGRRYLGLCAIGRRYPATLIRVYLAFLGAAQALYNQHDHHADPWMTLTGYFNSIRELAGTRRLVDDDIRSRLRHADQRGLAKRSIPAVEELTSRKSGTDIPRILERLDIGFDQTRLQQREADRKAGKKPLPPLPYDVILATNMISVGVDIARLGLMVVAGQPKTTAEYIQASSRVGRSKDGPGLVCTVYNWARPRDLSHYETFEHYHGTFHQHVEALSVTPFAARALDRGLSGVMVGLLRLWAGRLNPNLAAGTLTDQDSLLTQVFDHLIQRAQNATDSQEVANQMKQALDLRRDEWLQRVHHATDHHLGYKTEGEGVVGLLQQPKVGDWSRFTCLNALRDVEDSIPLLLDTDDFNLRVGAAP